MGSRNQGGWWRWLAAVAGGLALMMGVSWAAVALPYETEIRAFEAEDLRTPPPPDPILFVGSSTFTRWTDVRRAFPGFTILNRGFGGSQFGDVLNHFERVVLRYRPPLIVVYEGDNDLAAGRTPDQVFGDWTNFVGRVERELPGTGVVFLSVKPSPSRAVYLGAQRALNERVAADCARRARCRYVDILTPLLDPTGEQRPELFVSDMLHLNATGYGLVTAALAPALEAWAAAHPERSVRVASGTVLVDFGSAEHPSDGASSGAAGGFWNNVTPSVGGSSQGRLGNLVAADGTATTVGWEMVSRFNGANANGTTAAGPFPATATRDSLFGNTETFSGLANIFPAFRLTGLREGVPHRLEFFASRTGVSDNRETRYTVTGTTTATADLDAANNVASTAVVSGMLADPDGAIRVALSPGPRNNNANHFTYLGVLRVEEQIAGGRVFLVDLGAADTTTGPASGRSSAALRWNDVVPAIGTNAAGVLPVLRGTDGRDTPMSLWIEAPFRGAGVEGSTASTVFPAAATRDYLEAPGGAAGSGSGGPGFRIRGLSADRRYALGFHASRVGGAAGAERRSTRYRVGGRAVRGVVQEPAGNTNGVVWLTGLEADAEGGLGVRLEVGPGNGSAEGMVQLGVMQLEWRPAGVVPAPELRLERPSGDGGGWVVRVRSAFGRGCRLERSLDLNRWEPAVAGVLQPAEAGLAVELEAGGASAFFRVVDADESRWDPPGPPAIPLTSSPSTDRQEQLRPR